MYLFEKLVKNHPKRFGTFLALIGVLVLTPDTMVMRFSNLDRWPLMGWRGVLMGVTLLIIWRLFLFSNTKKKWHTLYTWPGIIVIISFSINSVTFTLGIHRNLCNVSINCLSNNANICSNSIKFYAARNTRMARLVNYNCCNGWCLHCSQ